MPAEAEGVSEVAPGVLRIHRATVNCYLVIDADGLTLIDAGLPGMWRGLASALQSVGAEAGDISAVLLTHGHFDHVGLCRRLRADHGVRAHVHERDRYLVAHPYRYRHERARVTYPLRYPGTLPDIARLIAAGALQVKGAGSIGDVQPGAPLDVPASPVPIWSPGHTDGHCAFFLPDRGVLFSGDALVTLDPYTGHTGPRVVARAATADVRTNLRSLGSLAETDAALVLPGHGAPYDRGVHDAVEQARRTAVP